MGMRRWCPPAAAPDSQRPPLLGCIPWFRILSISGAMSVGCIPCFRILPGDQANGVGADGFGRVVLSARWPVPRCQQPIFEVMLHRTRSEVSSDFDLRGGVLLWRLCFCNSITHFGARSQIFGSRKRSAPRNGAPLIPSLCV